MQSNILEGVGSKSGLEYLSVLANASFLEATIKVFYAIL